MAKVFKRTVIEIDLYGEMVNITRPSVGKLESASTRLLAQCLTKTLAASG